jgi:hypothetical protein
MQAIQDIKALMEYLLVCLGEPSKGLENLSTDGFLDRWKATLGRTWAHEDLRLHPPSQSGTDGGRNEVPSEITPVARKEKFPARTLVYYAHRRPRKSKMTDWHGPFTVAYVYPPGKNCPSHGDGEVFPKQLQRHYKMPTPLGFIE